MSNCQKCGAAIAPNSRFCTECGTPVAAPGPAPVPPMPPAPNNIVPPRPPMPGVAVPPVPPMPGPGAAVPPMPNRPPMPGPGPSVPPAPPVQPVAPPPPAVNQQVAAAVAPPAPAPAVAQDKILMATSGDLLNNGQPLAVIVKENRLVLMQGNGASKFEEIPDIRYAVVGDYDGDGHYELAIVTSTHIWLNRYSENGSVSSGKVALKEFPANLSASPFTRDGVTVLMTSTAEKIAFYVLHPARGLVEIAAATAPTIE